METKKLPVAPDAIAPDGAEVRVLCAVERGSFAHFELAAGNTSVPVAHRTVDEIWYFLRGKGQMWRSLGDDTQIVDVEPGVCITIPVGAEFQFRSFGPEPLAAVAVTMPPWPGDGEVRTDVEGRWNATVDAGPA